MNFGASQLIPGVLRTTGGETGVSDDDVQPDPYRPKPPLWEPPPRGRSKAGIILGGLCIGSGILLVLVLFPSPFLTESVEAVGQIEVTVVRLEGGVGPDEAPGAFHHVVATTDGVQHRFTCSEILRPGQKLFVSRHRSRLTGRVTLGGPYRQVAPKKPGG